MSGNQNITFIPVRCPNCNAQMSIENYRTEVFCSYCGTRLLIHNPNERVVRTIDEARLKEAEAHRDIELKREENAAELQRYKGEIELKKQETKAKTRKYVMYIVIALIALTLITELASYLGELIMDTISEFFAHLFLS